MSLAEATPQQDGQGNSSSPSLEERLNQASFGGGVVKTEISSDANQNRTSSKGRKRSFFGLGKKKDSLSKSASGSSQAPAASQESSQLSSASAHATSSSPRSRTQPLILPHGSPTAAAQTSPRLASPAGSQIFERDVQDSTVLQPNSPAIPTHIQTENHIPPVLDHASEAITNDQLHPDSVEIVTHSSHQPAAITVTAAGSLQQTSQHSTVPEWNEEAEPLDNNKESALVADNVSNYGSLDSTDARRLSFISFADVVQAEHGAVAGGSPSRDSVSVAGMTTFPPTAANRSPSPIRSPISSPGAGTSPPTSKTSSMKGVEMSPTRKAMGSPASLGQPHLAAHGGDLSIESMSQVLRRTGSTDLSSFRSVPTSPVDGPPSQELK